MSIRSWLCRSIGRTREGTKAHLLTTAEILDCSEDVLSAMHGADDERCEAMLVDHVSRTCGGTADWKEHPKDVMETLAPFLSPEESHILQKADIDDLTRPPEAIRHLDNLLSQTAKGVRALDTFGDFYILVVMPRSQLGRFDEVNKYWLATSSA